MSISDCKQINKFPQPLLQTLCWTTKGFFCPFGTFCVLNDLYTMGRKRGLVQIIYSSINCLVCMKNFTLKWRHKLLVLCLSISCLCGYAQQRATVEVKNASLEEVFSAIEKQTPYRFAYRNTLVENQPPVSVSLRNAEVTTILNAVLKGTSLDYSIVSDQSIVINSKKQTPAAESGVVRGTVTDAEGLPVIGALVKVAGGQSTATDAQGQFSVQAAPGSMISVSFLGYQPYQIKVDGQTIPQIVLKEDVTAIDEVVVVGYGTQKKVNVVGSISTVSAKQLEDRATSSVTQALTGQMPGVTITQPGGSPGVNTGTIRIRGIGSFGATPDALVLIDGIPGSLNNLNQDDIQSISVLKDAASAAIYGSRAANGVVLVTTKSGRDGKITINYNGYAGWNQATALPEYVNSWEYADLKNKAQGSTLYTEAQIQAMRDGSDPWSWANENFVDQLFSGSGFATSHDLSLSGGSERSQYFVSFGYLNQGGVVANNGWQRFNGRVNLDSKLGKKVKMSVRLQGVASDVKQPNLAGSIDGNALDNLVTQSLRFPGINPSVLPNGQFGSGFNGYGSPKAWLASASNISQLDNTFTSNIKFDYNPIPELTISAMGGYNFSSGENKTYRSTLSLWWGKENGSLVEQGLSSLSDEMVRQQYKTFQGTVDYAKTFGKHFVGLMVGYSWEDSDSRNVKGSRDKYPGNSLQFLDSGSPDNQKNSGGGWDWAIQSVFGRLRYNFDERYILDATFRYDGSSRFPTHSRYAFFPSVGVAWRISQEPFFQAGGISRVVDNLKIKASIGSLGNNNIGNYPYQSLYNLGWNYPFGQTVSQGAQKENYADPNLHWETTQTWDVAMEFALFQNRLSGSVGYFNRYTYDILYSAGASVSSIFGMSMGQSNTGNVSNRGWETELSYRGQSGKFSWNIGANFTYIDNRVESLGIGDVKQPNGYVGNGSSLFIGYPMNLYYGYKTDGVFLDQADIDSYFATHNTTSLGRTQAQTKPGDLRYQDISGPDGVPDGKVDANYDRIYLGSTIPKYTFGLTFGFNVVGIDFSMLIQGVTGVNGRLTDYSGYAFWSNDGNVQRWQAEGAFDPENPQRYVAYPRIEIQPSNGTVNTITSDFWIRDASYIRLKNVQLGYTFPQQWTQKIGIQRLRVYTSLENPLTWSLYPQGWDPEISTGGAFYPVLATYVFGLNIRF